MVLSNAEKQRRWREKRNRLAKQASSIKGLIAGLVRSVKDKTDQEIQEIADELWDRLRRAMPGEESPTRSKPGAAEPIRKPKQPTKPALVWENNFDGIVFVAKIERGSQASSAPRSGAAVAVLASPPADGHAAAAVISCWGTPTRLSRPSSCASGITPEGRTDHGKRCRST